MKRNTRILSLIFATLCLIAACLRVTSVLAEKNQKAEEQARPEQRSNHSEAFRNTFEETLKKSERGRTYIRKDENSEVGLANLSSRAMLADFRLTIVREMVIWPFWRKPEKQAERCAW